MNRTRFVLFLLLISAGLGAAGHPALAAQLVPLGPEDEVYTDVFPNPPVVAAQPDGSYVIAWDDDTYSRTDGSLIYRYIPPGEGTEGGNDSWRWLPSPTGVPAVDAVTAGRQGFDVTWHTVEYENEPTLFYRAHLDLRGKPVGKPVRLGGAGTEWVWQVRGNGYMAGWPLPGKHGIAARRLTASGQRTGPELRLNSRLIDRPADVSAVGLADAGFVAVWLGIMPGSNGTAALRARRFSPAGKPLGPDFDVNTTPLGVPDPASWPDFKVAAAPGGGFAVAWRLHQTIYLRWFNAAGIPLGPEVKATTSENLEGGPESIAFDDTGSLLLLWGEGYSDYRVRLFDPPGTPLGPSVAVNSDTEEQPWGGSLAWTGDSWLVAWVGAIFPYDQSQIFVRRFAKR